ncbi:MAG: hypothetical protein JXB50_14845 [Spirochaetes bacterium]|nr:hypothetical protein [Spirochaetota bacterium]
MEIEKFGEFLIRTTNGKVTGQHIINALMKQKKFSDGYKKLGEILVEDKIISNIELTKYLLDFDRYKNEMLESHNK